jgi:peptide/nickel transport system substrate-binding protein
VPRQRSLRHISIAFALAAALVAAACGGGADPGEADPTGEEEAGDPEYGGRVVYGLEAETADGWCLTESRLAIAGIMVARSIYDTLTVPDGDEGFRPHLAESIEPNDDHTEWTITVREGITFHDGSELDAEVVANNLNAYRGAYEGRNPDLFIFVFQDVEDVTAEDEMTVKVTTSRPWSALPATLYASGRLGIMAQAQLDDEDCFRNLIGTGPFEFVDWQVNDRLIVERNENYWRTDADGNQLPYLDEIEYRPVLEHQTRLNALQSGEIDAYHGDSNTGSLFLLDLREEAEAGQINLVESEDFAEVGHLMLNTSEPPFDNPIAREAAARAVDREQLNETLQAGLPTLANGLFAPGSIGYLEDTGWVEYDPERARELVQQYEEETGEEFEFLISSTPSTEIINIVDMTREFYEEVGMSVSTTQFDQSALIDAAITGNYQAMTWRNYPGFDPDTLYVWFYGGSPVNFGRFDDPEVNRLLDEGREADPDSAEREEIYQELNRTLTEGMYMLWTSWTRWYIPSAPDVYGIVGARPVGTDGSDDYTGFATHGHDPALMWREQ